MVDAFLKQCRENYFAKITPSNKACKESEGYKRVVALSKAYFEKNMYNEYSGFLMEVQYLIDLWAAHMLLEYGAPDISIKSVSLRIIKRYSGSTMAMNIAEEEKHWILINGGKYD